MPTIRHPDVDGTAQVPDAVVAFWTGPGGWQLVDDTAPAPAPPPTPARPRARRSRGPKTTPVSTAGAPDDVPGQGSSTTEPEE